MGFPHVAQVARVDRIRELGDGRQEVETIWIITTLTRVQANMRPDCSNWTIDDRTYPSFLAKMNRRIGTGIRPITHALGL